MKKVICQGVNINSQLISEDDSLPLLVLCHGLVIGSMATWYFSVVPELKKQFQILLYDQRGHGKSEWARNGYDLNSLVVDLEELLQHYGFLGEPIYLAGHSYGALIALHYSLKHPQQVLALGLVDAPLPAKDFIYPSMENINDRSAIQDFLPGLLKDNVTSSKSEPARRRGKSLADRLDFLFLQSSLKEDVKSQGDIDDDRLRTLNMPILLLYGEQSDCLSAGQRLKSVIKSAELATLDCGHYITVEAPKEMSQLLSGFFAPQA